MYMWHFLSDKDIAELYDITAHKVKNRRHDFNIKPVTSAIDRIERELYGREDWVEEELKSVLPFEYNNGNIPHTNSTPLNSEKENLYMKATGIVRRIDDLGRVVIPKEIRRTMRIREGDPLEIYTNSGGEVIFKKYSPIGELSPLAVQFAEALGSLTELVVIICDRDHCVAAAGVSKKEVLERQVTPFLEEVMEQRRNVTLSLTDRKQALEGIDYSICVAVPIIHAGDVSGAVVLMSSDDSSTATQNDIKLATVAADFLGKQME